MTFNLFDLIIAIESITSNDWTKLSDSIGTLIKLNVIPIRETQRKFQLQLKVIASLHHCIIALLHWPLCSIPFYSVPFYSIPFYSIPFYSVPFYSVPLYSYSIPFHYILFCSVWKTKGRSWGESYFWWQNLVLYIWCCEKW